MFRCDCGRIAEESWNDVPKCDRCYLRVAFADDSSVVRIVASKRYARDDAPRWEIAAEALA